MFGMPLHSISSHFPELYRLVSLRSINAENQERFFKHIKSSTVASNKHPHHILTNAVIRLQAKSDGASFGQSLPKQEGKIAREWSWLQPRSNTIITKRMIESNIVAFSAHRKRISDYLLDSSWHEVDDQGNWVFFDGEERKMVPEGPQSVAPMHIR